MATPTLTPPSNKRVDRSLILALAGIQQRGPLMSNGRYFRRLAGPVVPAVVEDGEIVEWINYELAFTIRFMRWLPDRMQEEFAWVFSHNSFKDEAFRERAGRFFGNVRSRLKSNPPPWLDDVKACGLTLTDGAS